MAEIKPLNFKPEPGVGYTVTRRADGGMHLVFSDLSPETIKHWHDFSLEHLLGLDRLTRNLYDLRKVPEVPEQAVRTAIEVNSDPAARNIRLAVVVANQASAEMIRSIAYQVLPEMSAAIKIFTGMEEAEAWLSKPLDTII